MFAVAVFAVAVSCSTVKALADPRTRAVVAAGALFIGGGLVYKTQDFAGASHSALHWQHPRTEREPLLALCITGLLRADNWLRSYNTTYDFRGAGIVRILVVDAAEPLLAEKRADYEAAGFDVVALPSLPLSVSRAAAGTPGLDFACEDWPVCFKPGHSSLPNSNNRQRWAVYAGVLRARQLGATHFLRVRTDILITDFPLFHSILGVPENITFLHWLAGAQPHKPDYHSDYLVASTLDDAAVMWCGIARSPWLFLNMCRRPETFLQERFVYAKRWRRREWCTRSRTLYHDLPLGLVHWREGDTASTHWINGLRGECPECDSEGYWCNDRRREDLDELTADLAFLYPPELLPRGYVPCTAWQRVPNASRELPMSMEYEGPPCKKLFV